MSVFQEAVLTGIIGGVIATAIVFFIQVVWLRIGRPFIEELLYSGLDVNGEWVVDAHFADGDRRKRNLHLRQKAHRITGTLVATSGTDEGAAYELSGEFKNLILTLTYVNTEKGARDRGTLTLMSKADGRRLVGKSAYYSTDGDLVATCDYDCLRKQYAQPTAPHAP